MEIDNIPQDNSEIASKFSEPNNMEQYPFQKSLKKGSKTTIAGILLIVAGLLAIMSWISIIIIDVSMIDTSLFQGVDPTITAEKVKDFYAICGTIGCILSVFPILGGIVTLKRKMRGLALVGGLIGLFMIGPLFASSILSLIGLIFVGLSKEEFQ